MKKYCVYIHKNKINGKIYVGQTSKSPNARFGLNGQQYCYNEETKFAKAIKKYGFNNFDHIIIKENLTKNEANLLESQLITKYDSFKNGYNMTLGGDGGGFINHHHKKVSIEKMKHVGKDNGLYGTHRPDYVKEAVKKAHAKAITQYDMNMTPIKTFESGTEIKRLLNYDNSFIARSCKTHKSAYGYYWRYASPTTTE
jgi:hypothetical protein